MSSDEEREEELYHEALMEELIQLPRWAIVALSVRCARRVQGILKRIGVARYRVPVVDAIRIAARAAAKARVPASYLAAARQVEIIGNAFKDIEGDSEVAMSLVANTAAMSCLSVAALTHDAFGEGWEALRFPYVEPKANASDALAAAIRCAEELGRLYNVEADIKIAMQNDLRMLHEYSSTYHWGPNTPVSQTVFGPLWPYGTPNAWPDSESMLSRFVAHMARLYAVQMGYRFRRIIVPRREIPIDCFISYSTNDARLAEQLHKRLKEEGAKVWFAPENAQSGQYLDEQIERAIAQHQRLLLVLSKSSMESDWVQYEIRNALEREKQENRRILFPIRIVEFDEIENWVCPGSYPGEDLAGQVRRYVIPDFTKWDSLGDFQKAFASLKRDLGMR